MLLVSIANRLLKAKHGRTNHKLKPVSILQLGLCLSGSCAIAKLSMWRFVIQLWQVYSSFEQVIALMPAFMLYALIFAFTIPIGYFIKVAGEVSK
jgi:hypothetical protein